jgi:diphosphomevalonate decarboxylase
MQAKVRARSNIALVKYWGKADSKLNLPAVGSISVTLDGLWTDTAVNFDAAFEQDSLLLNGREAGAERCRVSVCLDLLRALAGTELKARVESSNNFPTAAGLASSASGFAALVGAAAQALGLDLNPRELSILARRGSGSAARSIFGGFVEMHRGAAADGCDSFAEPLLDRPARPHEVVIALTTEQKKSVASGPGMARSAESSPYFPQWVASHPADMAAARAAILSRDFEAVATIAEASCLKMHAAALTSEPPLVYWNGATVECLQCVRALRASGVPVFFTIDAGPQVKAICLPDAAATVVAALEATAGVERVLATGLGPGLESLP